MLVVVVVVDDDDGLDDDVMVKKDRCWKAKQESAQEHKWTIIAFSSNQDFVPGLGTKTNE